MQPWPLCLAPQCHNHCPHAPALSAEAAHQHLAVGLELRRLRLEHCDW